MKGKWKLLIGLVLGGGLGWVLGFLRFPFVEKNDSFWMGFLACLAFLLLFFILLYIWNKHRFLVRVLGSGGSTQGANAGHKAYASILGLTLLLVAVGGLVAGYLIQQQNAQMKSQYQEQEEKIRAQSELIESIKQSNRGFLIADVLDAAREELKENGSGVLSGEMVGRIAALGNSLEPYRYFEEGEMSGRKLSPERGQLLAALAFMQIDSSSFAEVKEATSFAAADLSGLTLLGVDLSGADLRGANFESADLSGSNLREADLRKAFLKSAALDSADLYKADFRRAQMQWAGLNAANLKKANLNGADLSQAQLRNANLDSALFQWATATGVLLQNANLQHADLLGSLLPKANLSGADLREASLVRVDLAEAIFKATDLRQTAVQHEEWLERLQEKQVIGADEVRGQYKMVEDTTKVYRDSKFRLVKKGG